MASAVKPLSGEERSKWRRMVLKDVFSFINAPDTVKADLVICLEAVKREGMILEHCAPAMLAHRNIVLTAVQNNAEALHFADETLRNDEEIVRTAVRERGQLLRLASESLRANSELVLEVVHDLWFTAEYAADTLRYSPEFWREVIEQDPETGWMAFSYAPVELRSDPELVMEAIKVDPMAFKFASDELRNDREFVREAIQVNWIVLKHASARLRADAKVVLEAVSQDFEALQYASESLMVDSAFALGAAGHQGRALGPDGVAREFQNSKDWVLNAVKKNPNALAYVDDDHREDRDVINKSFAGRLGAFSGYLWKIDNPKWAAGTTALAMDALRAEDELADSAEVSAGEVEELLGETHGETKAAVKHDAHRVAGATRHPTSAATHAKHAH